MKAALSLLLLGLVLMTRPAQAELALATAKNCMTCHAANKRLLGPSFQEIAKRYAGQKDAVERMTRVIRHGGSGAWGGAAMPANAQLEPSQARTLAAWVLTQN